MNQSPAEAAPGAPRYARFETELQVRPDDIDLYQHVHSSRYLDYVLAARFDQMDRCYGMPMAEFQQRGLGWFLAATEVHYRRALGLGDRFVVRTWIEKFTASSVRVGFEIDRRPAGERSCDGWCNYVLISLSTARPVRIPDDAIRRYSVQ